MGWATCKLRPTLADEVEILVRNALVQLPVEELELRFATIAIAAI